MDNGHLIRYSAPTKYDTALYGAIWIQMLDDCKDMYIQVSKDDQNPQWIRIGKFLEKAFSANLFDEDFISKCLEAYNS